MSNNLLKGKRGIVFGALNEMSIAWKVAERAVEEGAIITLTNTPVACRMGTVTELSKRLNAELIPADATNVDDLEMVFSKSQEALGGKIDFVLHSIGMSPNVRKKRTYDDLDYNLLSSTLDISAISFHKMIQIAKKMDAIAEGGSILALTYVASQRTFYGYNDMNYTDWRGVFLILLVIGVLLLAGCLHFKETHTKERRLNKSLAATFMLLGPVLKNRRYRQFMLQQAFTMSVMFANIASSPFIIQQHYGYSPFAFSVWFAINAVALIMASFVSIKFKKPEQAMLTGAVGTVILAVIELFVLMNDQPFWMYESLIFLLLFTVGLTLPSSTTLAMESERKHAGSASALLGAGVFIMAGIVSPLVGIGNMLVTTGCVFVVGSVLALFCALRSRR